MTKRQCKSKTFETTWGARRLRQKLVKILLMLGASTLATALILVLGIVTGQLLALQLALSIPGPV